MVPVWLRRSLFGKLAGCGLVLGTLTGPVFAYEVVLKAPTDFEKSLSNASLLMAAKAEGVINPLDLVATAQAEYRRLLSVLYSQGYFGPEINILIDGREAATLPPFLKISTINVIEMRVKPGPKFRFGKTNLDPLAPEAKITESFAPGEDAQTGVISRAASQGINSWRAIGHAKARVRNESIIANHSDATLDVDIDLDPGHKLRFGDLTLSGNTRVPDERLREIIALPGGETFDPEELDRIAKRLRRAGVFRSVSISEAERVGPDDTLDIDIRLEDDKPHRITFGGELDSKDGLTVSASWLHRNLFGGGERLSLDGEIAGIGSLTNNTEILFGALFTRPATFHPDMDYTLGADLTTIENDIYEVDKFGVHTGVTWAYSDHLRLSGGVLLEASNSFDDYGKRQFRTFGVPVRAIWDLRDDKLDPTRGTFVNGTVVPYGSDYDGAPGTRMFADSRIYRGLAANRVVAAARFQLGTILGPSLANTPPDYLFLSGGSGTVRGQPYQSGFVTVGGRDSGGLSFIGFSGELRVKTTEAISTVLFYDAGFVGETSNPSGDGEWHSGAGVGVRYHTSIGPLRVDLGLPVSGRSSDGPQLYIGIGQAF